MSLKISILLIVFGVFLTGCENAQQNQQGKTPPKKTKTTSTSEKSQSLSTSTSPKVIDESLIEDLKNADENVRLNAAKKLGEMGPDAASAVKALAEALKDESSLVRAQAAHALGNIGKPSKAVAAQLVEAIKDPDANVRRSVVGAFEKIRPGPDVTLPLMIKTLKDADPSVVVYVMHTLAEFGEKVVPFMIEALKNEETQYWALLVLTEIGPKAKEAVPALISTLKDDEPEVRMEVLMCLAKIGAEAKEAVPEIIKKLDDPVKAVHVPAVYALGRIGPAAESAAQALKARSSSKDELLQIVSSWALSKIHPEDKEQLRKTILFLVTSLKSKKRDAREYAARGIFDLKAGRETVAPVFKEVMKDATPAEKNLAAEAIAALGEKVVPLLIENLKIKETRKGAAKILSKLGPSAKEAVLDLIQALSDEDPETRNEVLFALGRIGPDAKASVPSVIEALDDKDKDVRLAAVYALGEMGKVAKDAAPVLLKNLEDKDHYFCICCAWALAQVDPDTPETAEKVIPLLVEGLSHSESFVRLEAAEALGLLGPKAKSALSSLQKASSDSDAQVKEAVSKAIEQIEK